MKLCLVTAFLASFDQNPSLALPMSLYDQGFNRAAAHSRLRVEHKRDARPGRQRDRRGYCGQTLQRIHSEASRTNSHANILPTQPAFDIHMEQ